MMTPQEERELLRRELIGILAAAPTACFTVAVLTRRARLNVPEQRFSETAVAEALAFLEGLWLVAHDDDPLGCTRKFHITAQGTLFHERNP